MYEAFFKLRSRPFLAAPQTNRYFPGTVIENARASLGRAIERGEGAGLIIGPAGTGKTLLCQMLAEEFSDRFAVALLASGRLSTRQALLQAVLYELDLPYRGLDEGELRLSLLDHLEPKPDGHAGLLLIIDEAHALSWRLLEEVRMLTNLVRKGQPRVRVVLSGNPLLEERFASPRMSSFSQRLAARCYLEPLDSAETAEYVRAQIASVGGDAAQILQDDALRSIFRATDGVPRLINQVCDHALILAGLGGLRRLTNEAIDEAWADLQQLPAPWRAPTKTETSSSIIEFGGLDDIDDEPREAIPFRAAEVRQLQVSEPDEQLDAIAEQLSEIDESFHPAGAIGTEVELDFPEFGDPFSEEFVEEEVVLERYANDREMFAEAPRVASWEGKQLGSFLEPLAAEPWRVEPQRPKIGPGGGDSELQHNPPDAQQQPAKPVVPSTPVNDGPPEQSKDLAQPTSDDPIATVRVETSLASLFPPADDADLIVFEDSSRTAAARPRPTPDVRKMEYKQLFARLRRG
jgi:type II secretory pathway predicted ATPase ExeA